MGYTHVLLGRLGGARTTALCCLPSSARVCMHACVCTHSCCVPAFVRVKVTAKPISTTDVDEQDLSLVQWKGKRKRSMA